MKQLIALGTLILFLVVACKKDDDNGTTTVTKTTEELLTAKTWKADEIRIQLSNNTTTYYKRGSSGTAYDTDSLKFVANGTGFYYFMGTASTINWNFTDAGKTKMTIAIGAPFSTTIYMENVHLTDTYFKYAQYSSAGGASYLAAGTRLPN